MESNFGFPQVSLTGQLFQYSANDLTNLESRVHRLQTAVEKAASRGEEVGKYSLAQMKIEGSILTQAAERLVGSPTLSPAQDRKLHEIVNVIHNVYVTYDKLPGVKHSELDKDKAVSGSSTAPPRARSAAETRAAADAAYREATPLLPRLHLPPGMSDKDVRQALQPYHNKIVNLTLHEGKPVTGQLDVKKRKEAHIWEGGRYPGQTASSARVIAWKEISSVSMDEVVPLDAAADLDAEPPSGPISIVSLRKTNMSDADLQGLVRKRITFESKDPPAGITAMVSQVIDRNIFFFGTDIAMQANASSFVIVPSEMAEAVKHLNEYFVCVKMIDGTQMKGFLTLEANSLYLSKTNKEEDKGELIEWHTIQEVGIASPLSDARDSSVDSEASASEVSEAPEDSGRSESSY